MSIECCNTCPFAFTEDSEYFQTMGCLPSPSDIKNLNSEGFLWACHGNELKTCVGQFDTLFGEKPNPNNPLVSYHFSSLFGFEWAKLLAKNKIHLTREKDFIKNKNLLLEKFVTSDVLFGFSKFDSGFFGSYFNLDFYLRFIFFFNKKPSLNELFAYYKECTSILDKEIDFSYEERFDEFRFMFSYI